MFFSFAEVLFIPYLQASKPVFLIQSGPVGSLTLSAARETLPPAIRRSRRDWAPTIEANCIGESHRKSSKIHMIVIENHMTQEPPRPQDFSLNPWNRTSYQLSLQINSTNQQLPLSAATVQGWDLAGFGEMFHQKPWGFWWILTSKNRGFCQDNPMGNGLDKQWTKVLIFPQTNPTKWLLMCIGIIWEIIPMILQEGLKFPNLRWWISRYSTWAQRSSQPFANCQDLTGRSLWVHRVHKRKVHRVPQSSQSSAVCERPPVHTYVILCLCHCHGKIWLSKRHQSKHSMCIVCIYIYIYR